MKYTNDIDREKLLTPNGLSLKSNIIYFFHHKEMINYRDEYEPEQLTLVAMNDYDTRDQVLKGVQSFLESLGYQFKANEKLGVVTRNDQ